MKKFTMFWGCTIPARFPYIEKSVRVSLDKLGIHFEDIDGFTCCPERSLVKSLSEEVWMLTAARNLAVAEKGGYNIVTPCTGCHSVLKTVRSQLMSDAPLRNRINSELGRVGLQFTGETNVQHIVEFLYEDVGAALISKRVVKPLWGIKIAVHFGCHLVRPGNAVRWDDAFKPTKFNELVSAIGGKLVGYEKQEMCCGSYMGRVGNHESNLSFARIKLEDIKSASVDALAVVCPSCYQQFDLTQSVLMRKKIELGIPVLYLTELMALAFGASEEELGLSLHRVDTGSFVEKHAEMNKLRQRLLESFSLPELERCYSCRACRNDCPSALVDKSFDPTAVIGKVLEGKLDELLTGDEIWKCVECDVCHELCHQRYAMDETFRALKHLAISAGHTPKQVKSGVEMYLSTGMLGTPRLSERPELGLPELPGNGFEQWKELVKEKIDDR